MSERADPPNRFVILTVPRTGSNMLCTLLNSHPEILCHHEIFNPKGVRYAIDHRDGRLDLGSVEERQRDPLGFLERVWRTPCGCRHVGFKLNRRQNPEVLEAVLSDQGVKKIVLKRKNRIKPFVSWLIAEQLGQWEVYDEAELIRPRPRVAVDLAALQANIQFAVEYYAEVEGALWTSRQPYLTVMSDDLFDEDVRRGILDFLGATPEVASLQIRSVKQNSTDLREVLTNFAELEHALRGTELEADLYSTDF